MRSSTLIPLALAALASAVELRDCSPGIYQVGNAFGMVTDCDGVPSHITLSKCIGVADGVLVPQK